MTDDGRAVWVFRPPVIMLRLVDAQLLDGFHAWREAEDGSPQTASIRTYVVRTLLSIALHDGILTSE